MAQYNSYFALWKTCADGFDQLDIRLTRGEAIDHSVLQTELAPSHKQFQALQDTVESVDAWDRLYPKLSAERKDTNQSAVNILEAIRRIVEKLESNPEEFGFKPHVARPDAETGVSAPKKSGLSSIFKKSVKGFRNRSNEQQQLNTDTSNIVWRIYDLHRFRNFVADIKSHVGRFESLIAELSTKPDSYYEALHDANQYFEKQCTGCLAVSIREPDKYTDQSRILCYWLGREMPFQWGDLEDDYKELDHRSFDLYYKKKYQRRTGLEVELFGFPSQSGGILLDVECYSIYEHHYPGTITIAGLGIEAWEYRKSHHPRTVRYPVNDSHPPTLNAHQLLRRFDELRNVSTSIGWTSTDVDDDDLAEFIGPLSSDYFRTPRGEDLGDFFRRLNNSEIFVNFATLSSISQAWQGPPGERKILLWGLLWQVVLGKELIRRLEAARREIYTNGFTESILSTIILADLFSQNVEIELADNQLAAVLLQLGISLTVASDAQAAEALQWNSRAEDAVASQQHQNAYECYTQAIGLDGHNAGYRAGRAAVALDLGLFTESSTDAWIASQLDSNHAMAHYYFGQASCKLGSLTRAIKAFEKALQIAGSGATTLMYKGLEEAQTQWEAKLASIHNISDPRLKRLSEKKLKEENWDTYMKVIRTLSKVHEQQTEGLIRFAELMKWPYMSEVRAFSEEAYTNLLAGDSIEVDLWDWLYGLVLPGMYFSFKIMTALIKCTSSITKEMKSLRRFDCGLSLPTASYWRVRTVLGRVLGALPGVRSSCGWIGPCPPVQFLSSSSNSKPQPVFLDAKDINPSPHGEPNIQGNKQFFSVSTSMSSRLLEAQPRDDETVDQYMSELMNESNWMLPDTPQQQPHTCELGGIQLRQTATGSEAEANDGISYAARLVFKMTSSSENVTYELSTNPCFVTIPQCYAEPEGSHRCFIRERNRYGNVWTAEMLNANRNKQPNDNDKRVMIINAMGQGAELLARAWCSEQGKNAVIRKSGGACMVCAERAASADGFGTGVLIWVSSGHAVLRNL